MSCLSTIASCRHTFSFSNLYLFDYCGRYSGFFCWLVSLAGVGMVLYSKKCHVIGPLWFVRCHLFIYWIIHCLQATSLWFYTVVKSVFQLIALSMLVVVHVYYVAVQCILFTFKLIYWSNDGFCCEDPSLGPDGWTFNFTCLKSLIFHCQCMKCMVYFVFCFQTGSCLHWICDRIFLFLYSFV